MHRWLSPLILLILASTAGAHPSSTVPSYGEYPIGYRSQTMETSRNDVLAGPGVARRLQLEIWYPTAEEAQGPVKPWASKQMGQTLSERFAFPKDFESEIQTHAHVGAPPATGAFPVVVFSHGLSWPVALYQSYTEDFAARGYVVVAVNHPHGAELIEYDDGQRLDMSTWPRIENEAQRQAFLAKHVAEWEAAVSFVIDRFVAGKLPTDLSLNTTRIAVVGHSYGGTVAG